ncbi:MAG TPA: M15 family metallopeptidase [Kofleriaceae bacterium]|nr:M15 family metallopeptidase [Kofleriaceae bacterium]
MRVVIWLAILAALCRGTPPAPAPAPAPPAPPGWTDVAAAIPDAVLELRYATAANLTGAPLYPVARCWLRAPVAARLVRAADELRRRGHRLVLWDCYRPHAIQRALWARLPDPRYVAEPRVDAAGRPIAGSAHNRGAAVDVSLADRDGAPRAMPTDHDDFSPAARGDRARGPAARHLADLRAAMIGAGFAPLATEWWHFDAAGATAHALADEPLR